MRNGRTTFHRLANVFFFTGFLALALLAGHSVHAGSIPAWLDDAVTTWNEENPTLLIQFVDIKDSFVWYMLPKTPEKGIKEIRENIYGMAQAHGYVRTEDEELVTTGKPPSPNKPYKEKKCWRRNFTLNLETGRQRMLTTQICDDVQSWFAGFRIVQ